MENHVEVYVGFLRKKLKAIGSNVHSRPRAAGLSSGGGGSAIRKLRIKIVLVIVLVAAVMLGVIFGISYTMTRQDLRAQSLSMMQAIAANPFEPLPLGQSRQVRLPYFVSADRRVRQSRGDRLDRL